MYRRHAALAVRVPEVERTLIGAADGGPAQRLHVRARMAAMSCVGAMCAR